MAELEPNPSSAKPPEKWISFLGFVIVAKADLLAATAFLLSLASLLYQFSTWMRGPQASIYPPDVVYILFDKYPNNQTVTRFIAQMSFVNTASSGYDAIVRDLSVEATISFADKSPTKTITTQRWLNFVSVSRVGNALYPTPRDAAHPFPIIGGGAASYSVSFAPLEKECSRDKSNTECGTADKDFVSDVQFIETIAKADALHLKFKSRMVGASSPLVASCKIKVGVGLIQYLAENDWFAAQCTADSP